MLCYYTILFKQFTILSRVMMVSLALQLLYRAFNYVTLCCVHKDYAIGIYYDYYYACLVYMSHVVNCNTLTLKI